METKPKETVLRNRRIALELICHLLEEAMEIGKVPQPSVFGIVGEDDDEGDPVYDWCQELIETIDACEEDLLPHEEE